MIQPTVNWIKPDWPNQPFNLEDGDYYAKLGVRESLSIFPICYRSSENTSEAFKLNFFENTDDCTKNLFDVHWKVMNLTFALDQLSIIDEPYVLDIDLDFFATGDPELEHYLKHKKHQKYFEVLENLINSSALCLNNDMKKITEINQLLHEIFWGDLLFLPGSNEPMRSSSIWNKDLLNLWCNPNSAYETLVKISKLANAFILESNIPPVEFAILRDNHKFPNISCKANEYFGVCADSVPFHFSSKQEIMKTMENLGKLIQKIGGNYKKIVVELTFFIDPAVVTIARSTEGYTPVHLHPFIEGNLLAILDSNIKSPLKIKYQENLKYTTPNFIDNTYKVSENTLKQIQDRIFSFTISEMLQQDDEKNEILLKVDLVAEYAFQKNIPFSELVLQGNSYKEFEDWLKNKYKL